jgi:hypothetical protein
MFLSIRRRAAMKKRPKQQGILLFSIMTRKGDIVFSSYGSIAQQ